MSPGINSGRRTETVADNPHVTKMTDVHSTDTTPPGGRTAASEGGSDMMACGMDGKGLKGLFLTVACCAVPLILLLALPVLGTSLGGRIAPVVNTLAVLACPVGMALMMWIMRGRRAGTQQSIQEQPVEVALPPQD
jgi:hypothetical protein